MKKAFLLLALLLAPVVVRAQVSSPPSVRYVASPPSGACPQAPPIQVVTSTLDTYGCKNGTWGQIASGGGATTPGGSPTQLQINIGGLFGADPTLTFNTSTKVLGFQNGTIQPLGTAVSGTNQNSGQGQWCGSYWNGTAAANDCYTVQTVVNAGTNPVTLWNIFHTGSSGAVNGQVNLSPQLNLLNGGFVSSGKSIQFSGKASAYACFDSGGSLSATTCPSQVLGQPVGNATGTLGSIKYFEVDLFPSTGCATNEGTFSDQLACAWFSAYDFAFTNSAHVKLRMGQPFYPLHVSLFEPTKSFTSVSLEGTGKQASVILVQATLSDAVIYKNETDASGALPNITFKNFKIQGDTNVSNPGVLNGGCMRIWGVQELVTESLNCVVVPNGAPFLYQWGEPNNYLQGWVFQQTSIDVIGGNTTTQGSGAVITASQSGGNLSLVTTSGGSGYTSTSRQIPYLVLMGNKAGTSDQPCTVMPTITSIPLSGSAIGTPITFTGGTGCSGTIEAKIVEISNIPIGVDVWSTDSDFYDTVPLNTIIGLKFHGGNTRSYGSHPTKTVIGIQNVGNDNFFGSYLDTSYQWGMDFEQASPYSNGTTVEGTSTFANAADFALYHFNATSTVEFGPQGGLCVATTPGDFHEFLGPSGTVETTGWGVLNGGGINGNDTTCSAITLGDYSPKMTIANLNVTACTGCAGGLANTTVAVTGATQGANSCSSTTNVTVTGLTTSMEVLPGYSSNPSALTGWGSTGGMVFQAWPSATNTMTWQVCNQTGSSITYSSVTFNVGFK